MTNRKAIEDWPDLLGRSDVLILDTETTGFRNYSEVLQVSIIDTQGTKRFDEYILPKNNIPSDSTKIHGLTLAKLAELDAQPWNAYHDRFTQLTTQASFVLVYNLEFDTRLIQQTCKFRNVTFEPYSGRCIMQEYSRYRQVLNQWGSWKWHKLAAAARHEKAMNQPDVHNSLNDCRIVLSLMENVSSRL